MKNKKVVGSQGRFVDKRSKLTDDSIELVLDMRYPTAGSAASWKSISNQIKLDYGISISEQAVSQLFKRYQDIFIITKLSETLLEKRSNQIKKTYIPIKNAPDLNFKGALVAEATTSDHTILRVYCTEQSNMILIKNYKDTNQFLSALLVSDMTDFFGWSDAAKEIYDTIGINKYITIE